VDNDTEIKRAIQKGMNDMLYEKGLISKEMHEKAQKNLGLMLTPARITNMINNDKRK
jgi:hypothetical protein